MRRSLHTVVFLLLGLLASVLTPIVVNAQCNGADGTGIYFGSVANSNNGTICANNPVQPALMEIDIRNVMEGAGQVKYVIDWQDGTTQTVNATKTAANRFFASVTHIFPATGANVQCEYRPTVRIQYGNNAPCVASLGVPPRFVRWNTDNENTGELLLSETVRNVQTYRVCAGVETNVTFTDRSTLNCVPPELTLGQNDRMRWRQFVYGVTNTITGTVKIGGATPGFPYNGPVSQSVEPIEVSSFPVATTQVITVPATAQVGERFRIRMNYWNTCNSYTGGRPPVDTWAEILIVAQPTAPTGTDQTVCNGTTPNNFSIGGVPGGAIVNWYRNAAGNVPGTLITSGGSTNFNITAVPGYTNNTTAGDYKVWVSYRENIANALNCESPKILLTRTIKNAIPVPNPTVAPPATLCNTSQFTITFPGPASETFGGNTQYNFGTDAGVTVASSTANSVTYNTSVAFSAGQQYVDRTVTVTRRYTTGAGCDQTRNFTVRIFNQPVGGTLSNFPDRCEGATIGPINLTGQTGNVLGWEVSVNSGAWVAYTGPSCATCITPGVLTAGNYRYRALIGNSPCAPNVYSSIETVVVSASIGAFTAGPDQDLCGVTNATLAATLPALTTGQWTYVSSIPAGRPAPTFSNAASGTSTVSIANPTLAGAYTLRWEVTSGTCSVPDDVVIDFGSNPDLVPVKSIRECGEDATLDMPPPSIGTGVWTIVTAPGAIVIDDLNSPTSDVSLGAPFTYGTYVLRWTVTSGICAPATNLHTVIFDRPVTVSAADITTPQCLVNGGSVINLTGTIGGGATSGTWVKVTGAGAVSASTLTGNTVTATYTSTAADYAAGTDIQVKLVAAAGAPSVCVNVEKTINITIDREPVAIALPLSTCDNAIQLAADSPIPYGATGVWTGPGGITFDDPTDPETFVRNLPAAPSSVNLTWTLTSAGGTCTDAVTIAVNRVTTPNATNVDLLVCEVAPAGNPLTTSVTLADHETSVTNILPANRTIQWYRNGPPPLGIPIADPTVVLTNIADGAIFVARIQETATLCTSDAFVTVNIRPLPTATNANVAICESGIGTNQAFGIDLINDVTFRDAVTTGSNTVSWHATFADANSNSNPITAPFDLTGGRQIFARVEYGTAPSCPNIATVNLSVKPLPDINAIIGRSQVCLGDPATDPDELPVETYQVKAITGAKYHWTVPSGPTKFKQFGGGGLNDFFVLLQFPNLTTPATENISVWVELNGCSSGTVTLPITVNDQPIKPIIAGPEVVCENDDGVMFQVVSPNSTSNYTWQIKKVADDSDGGAFVQVGQGLDQIYAQFTNERVYFIVKEVAPSLCVSDTAQYWVDVNRRPKMMDVDPSICSDSPTGVVFAPDATSPAPIDRYDINIIAPNATLSWVNPTATPTYPWLNAPANAIEDHAFENLSAVPGIARYNVTPISVADGISCPGAPVDITITVNPEPQLDPGLDRSICSEEETGIIFLSAPNTFPADRFIIDDIIVPPSGVTPATPINIPLIADGTTLHLDNIISTHAWINTTGTNQTVVYRVRPVSSLINCIGNPPTAITVTVYPQTLVDAVPNPVLCNGELLNVPFTSTNNNDADFSWIVTGYSSDITIGSPMFGTGAIANMIIMNNSSTTDGTVTFEVRGVNSATEGGVDCANPARTFTVTVRNSPVANALVKHGCSDAAAGTSLFVNLSTLEPEINPSAGTPGIGITWYKNYDVLLGLSNPMTAAEVLNYEMLNGVKVYVEVENLLTNCKKIVPIEYRVTPGVFLTVNPDNLFCNNDNSGAIPIVVDSGTPSYSYQLNGGPSINSAAPLYTFSSLAAGNYTIDVVDGEGCRATEPVVLTQPAILDPTLTEVNPITCFLYQDGALSTTVTGGTAPYSNYLLLQTNTSNTTGAFSNLGQGTYTVRVTDANGCKADSNPLPFTHPEMVEIDNVSVLTDANGFNLSCRDAVDGEVAVTFSGGNIPNNYTITMTKASDPGNPITASTVAHNHTFEDLGFGNYSIVAEDAKGCPSLPAIAIIVNPPPFSPGFIGINQAVCMGDDAAPINQLVPAFGGVGNYKYQWQLSLTGSMNDAEWIDIPSATATTYDPGVLAETTYFRRLASSVSARTGTACEILGKDNIVQVKVNPLPVVALNGPPDACQGEPFTLTLSMTGGAAPIEYDYSVGSTTFLNMVGTENTPIAVSNFQAAQDYTLLRVKDLNGCVAANVPQVVHVDVIKVNAEFTVLAPSEQCSGGTFSFQWTVEPGISYTWDWSDGTKDEILDGDRPAGVNTISHVFTGNNTQSSTIYPVRLIPHHYKCQTASIPKNITVLPTVRLNIIPGDTTLCSGESIRFLDQSQGVDNGRWYYRPVGSGEELEVRSGPLTEMTYQMFNTTTTNPIFYEVVYEASNSEGCSDTYRQEVKVYRGITAGILNTPDPPDPFVGGISTIEFTNNSAPLDPSAFEYTWDFDDARATPPTGSGINPITVDYFKPGLKNVKLTAVNILSRDENNTCSNTIIKPITIMLPTVGAAFKATPLAACFPVNVTVENLSPGADTFYWELYNQTGLVGTSTLREPEFRILTPGVYDIYLTASYYSTGQTANAEQKGIEVFDVPTALFEMRPNPLYVPDTELQTFNKSARATEYHWDFDDGTLSNEFEPRHFYKLEGKYNVQLVAGKDYGAKDIDGDGIIDGNVVCYDTTRNELVALDGGFVKLPNAFTPSANGSTGGVAGNGTFNDVFLPIARGVEEFEMQIFDRWGNMLFETQDRNVGWDGYDKNRRQMPAGVYVYKLIMRLSNGQRTTKIGDVTLIR